MTAAPMSKSFRLHTGFSSFLFFASSSPRFLGPFPQEVYGLDGVPKVRDHDAPANDERYVHRIVQLGVCEAGLDALPEVVVDAVVAAEDHRGDEAEELLRAAVEGAVAIGGAVEREEALDAEVILFVEEAPVHPGAVGFETVEAAFGGLSHGRG